MQTVALDGSAFTAHICPNVLLFFVLGSMECAELQEAWKDMVLNKRKY